MAPDETIDLKYLIFVKVLPTTLHCLFIAITSKALGAEVIPPALAVIPYVPAVVVPVVVRITVHVAPFATAPHTQLDVLILLPLGVIVNVGLLGSVVYQLLNVTVVDSLPVAGIDSANADIVIVGVTILVSTPKLGVAPPPFSWLLVP